MNEYRVLDLFSGIGGFSLGLERAGMRTVAFCEIDDYCRAVLKKHWPDVPHTEDITKREFRQGEADVICGGFPCQDISAMGHRAGLSGERSGLYRELVRAIRVVRPRHAIMENVADLIIDGLGTVLGDLAQIRHDAEWHCIPAESVGAPHQRDRIWIITNSACEPGLHKPYSGEIAQRLPDHGASWAASSWNEAEPKVCRVDDGISDRVVRTEKIGNAVIPQIPELIGRAIIKAQENMT